VIKALVKLGYTINDQKGSHIHLRHPVRRPLTVPKHPEIARGTLRIIIQDADLTVEKFLELL
jgi:predicted RNA binding protein YcfA (HicA-like mRNA interferase family)